MNFIGDKVRGFSWRWWISRDRPCGRLYPPSGEFPSRHEIFSPILLTLTL